MFTSLGYFEQEGIMEGLGYKRGDARVNSDHTISKRIHLRTKLLLWRTTKDYRWSNRQVEEHSFNTLSEVHHISPVYNPDNYGGFFGAQGVDASDPENPVRVATMDNAKSAEAQNPRKCLCGF